MGDLRDKVKAVSCNSWKKLSTEFEQISYAKDGLGEENHWIYRGHGNRDWWLKPSVELFQESLTAPRLPYSIRQLEQQFFFDFKSSAAQFLANLPESHEMLEWLAVMQHYGTPTRLLDWTYSPAFAAYFALRSKPDPHNPCDGTAACVWALNLGRLRRLLIKKLRKKDWASTYKVGLGNVVRDAGPALVMPFLPQNRYSRMSAQQGLFLVKTLSRVGFMSTLDGMCSLDDSDFLKSFVIPHDQRIRMLGHLLEQNIHEVGIFPGADGLGRFVRIKVEVQAQTLGLM
jgi:hypothetical protein